MKKAQPASGRTGRPPGFDRDRAIQAAMDLFWERGVEPVTSSELADAMGIRRSSFYNSFAGKEQVLKEALRQYAAIAPDRHLDAIEEGEPVLPEIVRFLKDLCRLRARDSKARGCLVCNSVAELAGTQGETAALLEGMIATRLAVSERLFKQAIQQGELPETSDYQALARSFVAFLLGLNLLSKVVRDEKALWSACKSYLTANGMSVDVRRRRG